MRTHDDDPFDPMPEPPEPPHDGECCESGCGDQCVWNRYNESRAEFERAITAWRARHPADAHFR
ncbi:oxidoreductase-like domain-containing protein [Niveibacterium microcysteis]|uniref:Oxidoreductase-like domain-containing protein n=1 Tax=Niveibacterium microcysteis TaxID=2811415 RepID=A0ABX7M7Z7_9RHOO|nr:oxidoreductase-like domain-containing protein [Niveibacterium microcysteis]QSI77026.1 hypothetical protein JY500_21700 [Niveibacterium microcysteis]